MIISFSVEISWREVWQISFPFAGLLSLFFNEVLVNSLCLLASGAPSLSLSNTRTHARAHTQGTKTSEQCFLCPHQNYASPFQYAPSCKRRCCILKRHHSSVLASKFALPVTWVVGCLSLAKQENLTNEKLSFCLILEQLVMCLAYHRKLTIQA